MSKAKTQFIFTHGEAEAANNLEECFIITPIGAPDSDIFKKTTGLLEAVIDPVLKKLNFKAVPAHKIASPGSIPKQILRHIVEDRLVIANLTGLNPNVMYELAVRHAVKLPLVMLAEHGTILPFDVKDQRTIFYSDTYSGVEACKLELELAINHVLAENYIAENPIYDAIETNQIMKSIAPESKEEYLVNRLDRIETLLSGIGNDTSLGIQSLRKHTHLKITLTEEADFEYTSTLVISVLVALNVKILVVDGSSALKELIYVLPELNDSEIDKITSNLRNHKGIQNIRYSTK